MKSAFLHGENPLKSPNFTSLPCSLGWSRSRSRDDPVLVELNKGSSATHALRCWDGGERWVTSPRKTAGISWDTMGRSWCIYIYIYVYIMIITIIIIINYTIIIIIIMTGWCFGTFFHMLGIIIPTDFHIFQRGWNHQLDNPDEL